MSPAAVDAMKYRADADVKVADKTHAVPAHEQTKQVYAMWIGGIALGSAALAIGAIKLQGEHLAWVLIAVTGIFGLGAAAPKIIEAIKKKG